MKKYYYTIGEVSNLLGVKAHVIRFWEGEFAALRPKKGEGRIRKYSEHHIELLKKIQDLLYNQRFTIEGARQKLKQERNLISAIAQDADGDQLSLNLDETPPPEDLYDKLCEVRAQLCRIKQLCNQYIRK
ncbi:MAG: MerR family transcriptional regulator [Candidatus Cloacimonetes bacterium]|nr:MerR family transcriptional regulator [Candidatus Cloacimonadota bacterium]